MDYHNTAVVICHLMALPQAALFTVSLERCVMCRVCYVMDVRLV